MIRVAVLGDATITACEVLHEHEEIALLVLNTASLSQTMASVLQWNVDVVILDHENTTLHPDVVCAFLNQLQHSLKILVLIEGEADFNMLKKTGFSVRGYLSTQQLPMLLRAVKAVHEGEAWLPRKLVAEMLDRFAANAI